MSLYWRSVTGEPRVADHVLGVSRWLKANHFVIQHMVMVHQLFFSNTFYWGTISTYFLYLFDVCAP